MKSKHRMLAWAMLIAAGLATKAQSQSKDPLSDAAKKEGKVVFYSSEDRTALAEPVKVFEAKYGIPIEPTANRPDAFSKSPSPSSKPIRFVRTCWISRIHSCSSTGKRRAI